MSILWTVGFFLLALAILIVVHEYGHYSVARICGVKVLRFSVGFGRPLWVRRFGPDQTEWAVCAIPLGGYVRMLDEREGEVRPDEQHRAFNRQTVGKRIAIVFAGPAANFLLALGLYWVVFMAGVPELRPVLEAPPAQSEAARAGLLAGDEVVQVGEVPVASWQAFRLEILKAALASSSVRLEVLDRAGMRSTRVLDVASIDRAHLDRDFLGPLGLMPEREKLPAVVGKVLPGGAAFDAGLRPGDRITRIEGKTIVHWGEVVAVVRESAGRELRLAYTREGRSAECVVKVAAVTEQGQTIGRIGLAPQVDDKPDTRLKEVRYGPLDAAWRSIETTWDTTHLSVSMMWKMLWGEVSWRNLSGPVAIADYAGRSASMGPSIYVTFIALVSISLAIVNLLPIPVLDGGHLMYYLAEIIKGRPLSDRAMEIGQKIGMSLLFMLMALALFNDIDRLFSGFLSSLLSGTASG